MATGRPHQSFRPSSLPEPYDRTIFDSVSHICFAFEPLLVRTRQPQAILERPHRKGRHGQAEVGTGVQGILGFCRLIYEFAGNVSLGRSYSLLKIVKKASTHILPILTVFVYFLNIARKRRRVCRWNVSGYLGRGLDPLQQRLVRTGN